MIAFDKIGITMMALGRINDALDAFQASDRWCSRSSRPIPPA
jgi:hypothetical protein